jgi:hypothetical protein
MKDDATPSLDVKSRLEVEWSNELLSSRFSLPLVKQQLLNHNSTRRWDPIQGATTLRIMTFSKLFLAQ